MRFEEQLGPPALKMAGLQLWVHGREHPDSLEFYDANWLRVTAHCGASGASVRVDGAILMVTDIERFGGECDRLLRGEAAAAKLEPLEPYLKIAIEKADRLGHLRALVHITADHLLQAHRMEFDLDQSHLPGIIKACSAIVQDYPVRGRPQA